MLISGIALLGFYMPSDSGEKVTLGKFIKNKSKKSVNHNKKALSDLKCFFSYIQSLGITSLLSTTVFLMLVAEGMPPTSEALPLIGKSTWVATFLGIYYGVTIFIVSLATAMTVLTVNSVGLHV